MGFRLKQLVDDLFRRESLPLSPSPSSISPQYHALALLASGVGNFVTE
jgi:hypothetical protein